VLVQKEKGKMQVKAADGTDLYYEVAGQGPAVVFAHGAGGNSASWYQQVPHFYKTYTTLVFDHRGFGRSKFNEDKFSTRFFADDLKLILDHAGIDQAALVCQSMGGWTGIDFAVAHPHRVTALVMSHTTGSISSPEIVKAMQSAAVERKQDNHPFGSLALAMDLPLRDPVKAYLYQQIGWFNTGINLSKILSGTDGLTDGIKPEQLSKLTMPVLFITSKQDRLIPSAAVHHAAGLLPNTAVAHFDEVGHSSYFECAEQFNVLVADFLDAGVNTP